jgi:HEAT repeat protein
MSHIFISYNQADADFAAIMSIHIEREGVDTWMDKSRLRPGLDWSVEIDEGIINSHALIVVMSPEAKASEYVTYEWSFALGAGVPVIPVLYKETVLHPRLARLQYLRFTDTTVRPWSSLIETVNDAVGKSVYALRVPRNAPVYIKSAIIALDSANDADREGALKILGRTDHPAARGALLTALQHPIQEVRWGAALQIENEESAIPVLIDAILSPGSSHSAIEHISKFGKPAQESLLQALKQAPLAIKPQVGQALQKFDIDEGLKDTLINLLHDPDPQIRMGAIHALHYKWDFAVYELLEAANDTDNQVKGLAFSTFEYWALRFFSIPTDTLLLALQHESARIRNAAVRGFRSSFRDRDIQGLIDLLKDKRPHVALSAYKILNSDLSAGRAIDEWTGTVKANWEGAPAAGRIYYSDKNIFGLGKRKRYERYYVLLSKKDGEIVFQILRDDKDQLKTTGKKLVIDQHDWDKFIPTGISIDITD